MSHQLPIQPCLCADYLRGDSGKHVVEAKVDGLRAIVQVDGDNVRAWTRNGLSLDLPIGAVIDITDLRDKNRHAHGDTLLLDCELTGDRLWLLDLPLVDGSYRVRRAALEALFFGLSKDYYACASVVPILYDPELDYDYPEDIDLLVNNARRDNFEGIVLKHPDAPYQQGARAWFKVKPERTLDLVVKSVKSNGSLVVTHDGRDVTVGIGLSKSLRERAKAGAMLGAIIEVRFQEETAAGSLRHPVLVRERTDKREHN